MSKLLAPVPAGRTSGYNRSLGRSHRFETTRGMLKMETCAARDLGLQNEGGTAIARQLSVLIINKDLPRFPGGIAIEFLNTIGLVSLGANVGLVSMAHSASDLDAARRLRERGVSLYLWKNPSLETEPRPARIGGALAGIHRAWQRRVMRLRVRRDKPED